MLHAQTKMLRGMISGLQVEPVNILRLQFVDLETIKRFLKMGLRYKLVVQDPQTKNILKESPYVFFADCELDQQGMCLCFPFELDAVPNLLCISQPGIDKISTYVPHIFSLDLPSSDQDDEDLQSDEDGTIEESSKILEAFAEITKPDIQPVAKRNHLRLVVSNK